MEIDIDRYIGNPFSSMSVVTHDVILTRSILRAGDPHVPGAPGAVLEYRRNFALATLMPRNRTALVQMPVQQLFYVQSGEGRLDDGAQYWDLHEGVAFLIPPNGSHRLNNTRDTLQAFFYFGRYTTPAPTNFKEEEGKVPGKPLR